ncbi:MAG: hypothetical protein ICV66_08710 [Chitinophagaceae bacterium]|nr:hypothetical protein [Chitinophagaceae bacterium]
MRIILFLLILFSALMTTAQRQDISITNLVNFTSVNMDKFHSSLSRAGFAQAFTDPDATKTFLKKSKDKQLVKKIITTTKKGATSILYETSSEVEYNNFLKQLEEEGYSFPKTTANTSFPLYQKGCITVRPEIKVDNDEKPLYCFHVERQQLPQSNEIQYAEDLLPLTSHEYIASVFGKSNVKKDFFYLSPTQLNVCTVLYPNTSLQAVFVWKDQVNYRDPLFILVSGQSRTKGSLNLAQHIEMNKWRSARGIYQGMSLKELTELNEQPISFSGWETDEPGFVVSGNKGKIDFSGLEVELSCLNCNEDKFYTHNSVINSSSILKDNRYVYVSTLVILPRK